MFEKIGKFAVGCLVFYLVLSILPVFIFGAGGTSLSGLVVLGIVGSLAYANRERIGRFFSSSPPAASGPSLASADEEAGRVALAQIRAMEHRFPTEAHRLAEQLPAEPLDNPAIVDLSHLYLHEPPEALHAITREYSSHVSRFVRWQESARQLLWQSSSLTPRVAAVQLEAFERLDAELTAIQDYVSGLEARARDARMLPELAIGTIGQAAGELDQARTTLQRATEQRPSPELDAQLRQAAEKLREARAALGGQEARPVTADRLAREAMTLATEVRARAEQLIDLPGRLARRGQDFHDASARVRREIARARQWYHVAEEEDAPSCLVEIRGLPDAAERAFEHAQEIWRSATDTGQPGRTPEQRSPEEVVRQEESAFAALEEASQVARRISEHMEMLQETARGSRGKLAAAEAEIDRGWAFIRQMPPSEASLRGREELLERASQLVAQARAELEKPKPDWLSLVTLTERSRELAAQVQSGIPAKDPAVDVRAELARARELAKVARDRALATSWTADEGRLVASTLLLINQVERAYQRAVTLESELGERPREHQSEMLETVREAYRTAQELGEAAYEQARADLRQRR